MLLFTSPTRNQIKKSMSDRTNQSSILSILPKHTRLSHSDIPTETCNKKSSLSFHLLDSIFSRSGSKSLSINISRKKPTMKTSSISNIQLPDQARCLYHYNAIKQDEISVHRGEYVQIITVNPDNRWLVHRNINRTSTTTKGWLPGFVLGLKYPTSTVNNPSSLSSNHLNHL